jgi:succinate dehydrogenase assembly factor 1
MSRKSGLQKDVLSLYRRSVYRRPAADLHKTILDASALRMVRTKPPSTRPKFLLLERYNFRAQASAVSPRDVGAIEHLLRRGSRRIEVSEDPSVKDCWVSQEMKDWEAEQRRRHISVQR